MSKKAQAVPPKSMSSSGKKRSPNEFDKLVDMYNTEITKAIKFDVPTSQKFKDLSTIWKNKIGSYYAKKINAYAETENKYNNLKKVNSKLLSELQEHIGNILVYVRPRPLLKTVDKTDSVIEVYDDTSLSINLKEKNRRETFAFDRCFRPDASQDEVYSQFEVYVPSLFEGYNVSILAYGQTGSGKTYTMFGPDEDHQGLSFKMTENIFQTVTENLKNDKDLVITVSCSMVEVYNEKIYDLLSNKGKTEINIMNDLLPSTYRTVSNNHDISSVYQQGLNLRETAATKMNDYSSRSHCILIISIQQTNKRTNISKTGKLYLVDLAGSERVSKSGAVGDRLTEANHINKSLSSLKDVLQALDKKDSYIPYRNSKLTLLLKESLNGNSKTMIICTLTPDSIQCNESLSTLLFAKQTKEIKLGKAILQNVNAHENNEELEKKYQHAITKSKEYEKKVIDLQTQLNREKKKYNTLLVKSNKTSPHESTSASSYEEVNRLKKSIKSLKKTIDSVTDENKHLSERVNTAVTQDDYEKLLEENESLRKEVEKLTYQIESRKKIDNTNRLSTLHHSIVPSSRKNPLFQSVHRSSPFKSLSSSVPISLYNNNNNNNNIKKSYNNKEEIVKEEEEQEEQEQEEEEQPLSEYDDNYIDDVVREASALRIQKIYRGHYSRRMYKQQRMNNNPLPIPIPIESHFDEEQVEEEEEEQQQQYTNTEYDENGNYIGYTDPNYDENGNYIGTEQYDENGNYIDPNYDENGNYIGPTEGYDENGNYVDPNYDENGNYIGTEGYDENGNYIGGEGEEGYTEGYDEEYQVTQSKLYNDQYNAKKVQENRMRKLIGEDIEADEYEIQSTGKIVCISHRLGKKHKKFSESFNRLREKRNAEKEKLDNLRPQTVLLKESKNSKSIDPLLSATSKIIEKSLNDNEITPTTESLNTQKYFFSSRKRPRDSAVLLSDRHKKRGKTLKIPINLYENSTKSVEKAEEDEYYCNFGWRRNANGEWYRDETVEFDSDEEIPIPPDYVNH